MLKVTAHFALLLCEKLLSCRVFYLFWCFHSSLSFAPFGNCKQPFHCIIYLFWLIVMVIGIYLIFLLWDFLLVAVGFSRGSMVKNPPASAGGVGLIPGLGRSPGEGNGNPLQYSCLENHMDRGTWWSIACGSQRVRYYWTTKQQRLVACVFLSWDELFSRLAAELFSLSLCFAFSLVAISYTFLFLDFHPCFGEASSMISSERWMWDKCSEFITIWTYISLTPNIWK